MPTPTRMLRIVLTLAALPLLTLSLALIPADAQQSQDDEWEIPEDAVLAFLVDIVDGDTFDAEVMDEDGDFREERIRLIGIDTPETSYSFGNEPECYGEEATKRTESLLVAAEEIWLSEDVSERDRAGRLLRYVWIVSGIDGEVHFLNRDLVAEGYALANTYRPDDEYQDVLDDAEEVAIEEARGMWLECDASVSMDPDLEDSERGPDNEPIDRTRTPIDDAEAVCSFFESFYDAQDFLELYPEIAELIDPDGDGVACEGYFFDV